MAPPLSSSLPKSASPKSASPKSASPKSASLKSALRRHGQSTFTSHLGTQPGDHSCLLVRERSARTAACEHFALLGSFDPAAAERLFHSLRGLPLSTLPLVLDLRGVNALDEAFLARLLKLRRELSGCRAVSFQIADDGPVPALVCRLGLEEKFGLTPARLPLRRTAAAVSPNPLASRAEGRKIPWVTSENR